MHDKSDYIDMRDFINDKFSIKLSRKLSLQFILEDKELPSFGSSFVHLNLNAKIPNDEVEDWLLHKPSFIALGLADMPSYCDAIGVLSHEFGHFLSSQETPVKIQKQQHRAMDRWDDYERPFKKTDVQLILNEEKRAWRLGFAFMDEVLGLDVCEVMKRQRDLALRSYRYHLKRRLEF